MEYNAVLQSPIGRLGLRVTGESLSALHFVERNDFNPAEDSYAARVIQQLNQYFGHKEQSFDLTFHLIGTGFQRRVWQFLSTIPYGITMSYGEIAEILQTSPRAVGNACRHNPIAIIIPCHRVIGKNHMGGYSGATQGALLNKKMWLLKHEKNH